MNDRSAMILSMLMLGAAGAARAQERSASDTGQLKLKGLAAVQSLPLLFEENRGQMDRAIQFAAHRSGIDVQLDEHGFFVQLMATVSAPVPDGNDMDRFLDSGGGRLVPSACASDPIQVQSLQFTFVDAARAQLRGQREIAGRTSYLRGSDRSRWVTAVKSYQAVRYVGLYPGIEVEIYDAGGMLEYDVLAEPGADIDQVVLRCTGAESLTVAPDGALVARTDMGSVTHRKPVTYRIGKNGARTAVESRFRLLDDQTFRFEVDDHSGDALVIDPGLVYSTLVGGSSADQGTGITVDSAGMVYVCGLTNSTRFPQTTDLVAGIGSAKRTINHRLIDPNLDAFVIKLDLTKPPAEQIVYSAVFGGSDNDSPANLRVDDTGAVYVTGQTYSTDFPVTPGAYQGTLNGLFDIFVGKIDPLGKQFEYATYLGGSGGDYTFGIAVNALGETYLTGGTDSLDYPTTPGVMDLVPGADVNGFVTKVDATGTGLAFSTFIDGVGFDDGWDIEVDVAGDMYVTGRSGSPDFPTTAGTFQPGWNGSLDSFVLKIVGDGSSVQYGTFVAALRRDEGHAIEFDDTGVYVTGVARSEDWPTTPGSYDTIENGGYDSYVFKLDPTLTTLMYSTFIGGVNHDVGWDLGIDLIGQIYATGVTFSPNFPTTVGSYSSTFNGLSDPYIVKFDNTGAQLLYSTFLGRGGLEEGIAMVMGGALKNQVYLTGHTYSKFFPTTPDAFDRSWNGDVDAYVAWLDPISACEAGFSEYGTGWPGTSGIPTLTLDQNPVICTDFALQVGNSFGAVTQAVIFIGLLPADVPTDYGGSLLVTPNILVSLALSPGTSSLPLFYTCDSSLCGLTAYMQVLEVDPGASKGIAFTPGLKMSIGTQ